MQTLSAEIMETMDAYRCANEAQRMLMGRDAMQRLFIAERVWKGIKAIDEVERRMWKGLEE